MNKIGYGVRGLMTGLLMAAGGMAQAADSLVVNGGFETVENTTVIAPDEVLAGEFPGWDTAGQLVDIFTGIRVGPGSGQYSAGFNDGRPGTGAIGTAELFQTVPTVAGSEYSFSFDYGMFNLGISDNQTMGYSILGFNSGVVAISGQIAIAPNTGTIPPTMATHSFRFTANDTSMTILFEDLTTVGDTSDGVLDNVRVELAPALCEVAMSQQTYLLDETLEIATLRFANLSAGPLPTRLRLQLRFGTAFTGEILDMGADGSFGLPAGFDSDFGPTPLFSVPPDMPQGTWSLRCALEDPASGDIQAEGFFPFEVQ